MAHIATPTIFIHIVMKKKIIFTNPLRFF